MRDKKVNIDTELLPLNILSSELTFEIRFD